jgi:hypothetical protein
MTYEILTPRWTCPECGAALRLRFSQSGAVEEGEEAEYVCDQVTCSAGHAVPDDLVQEASRLADEEFYAAMERGYQVGQVWQAPAPQDESVPSDMPPMEG